MVTQWGDLKSNDREMKMTLLHPAQITLFLGHHAVRPRRCCLWAAFSLEAGRGWASKHSASIWMRQLPAGKPSDIIVASSGTIPADASELIRMDFLPPISSCSCTDLHSFWDTICFQHELTCETEKGSVGLAQMQKPKAVSPPRIAALGSQLQLQPWSELEQAP